MQKSPLLLLLSVFLMPNPTLQTGFSGKRSLSTGGCEATAGWGVAILAPGIVQQCSLCAAIARCIWCELSISEDCRGPWQLRLQVSAAVANAIRSSVEKIAGVLLMPFSSMEAVMAEKLPLGAGSSLQVHFQWQYYQCLMLRHLWSGHGADIWNVNALGAAMELGPECGHTQNYTPGSMSILTATVALVGVLGMGVHRAVMEVWAMFRVVEVVTLVLGCHNSIFFFGRRVVWQCLPLWGWVVMMNIDYFSGKSCWCPLQMSWWSSHWWTL